MSWSWAYIAFNTTSIIGAMLLADMLQTYEMHVICLANLMRYEHFMEQTRRGVYCV